MMRKLSELDKAILRLLQKNADLPYKNMAVQLKKSEATICNHIKKLKKWKVIISTKAHLDLVLLNIDTVGYIYLSVKRETGNTMERFKAELNQIKGLCSCTSITGTADMKLKIATENKISFNRIKDRIASIPYVTLIYSYLELEEIIPDKGFEF
jgi:DNA-binding Lrp family transcriptional regulator